MPAPSQGERADEEKDRLKHARILSCYARESTVGLAVLIFGE